MYNRELNSMANDQVVTQRPNKHKDSATQYYVNIKITDLLETTLNTWLNIAATESSDFSELLRNLNAVTEQQVQSMPVNFVV